MEQKVEVKEEYVPNIDDMIEEVLNSTHNQQTPLEKLTELFESKRSWRFVLIEGPARSGKTFLLSSFCSQLEDSNVNFNCFSWFSMAAALLPNSGTVFMMLNSDLYDDQLRRAAVFIVDGVQSISYDDILRMNEKLNRLAGMPEFQLTFGGKMVVFTCDFRQNRPLSGERNIATSNILNDFHKIKTNHILTDDEYWEHILTVAGNSLYPAIEFPEQSIVRSKEELIETMFESIRNRNEKPPMIILTLTKENDRISDDIMRRLDGPEVVLFADNDLISTYTGQLINLDVIDRKTEEIGSHCFASHKIVLKKFSIVHLLQNFADLTAGTRLLFFEKTDDGLKCEILDGTRRREIVYIGRTQFVSIRKNLYWGDRNISYKLHRTQYPIALAFSTTLHISQGRIYDQVGIYDTQNIYGHGQLYTAITRCRKIEGLKLFMEYGNTLNTSK